MNQLTLTMTDPVDALRSYLGSQLLLEDMAIGFLTSGRMFCIGTDVPEHALIEAAQTVWTAEELAELRALVAARTSIRAADDPDAYAAARAAECRMLARLMVRISPERARRLEDGV